MNHTEKTLKNSLISVCAQVCNLAIQFVNRAIFVLFLDIELLGYQSLFSNIFSYLSLAEFGIGNVIAVHLYKAVVKNNIEDICKLMLLFKWLYRAVAFIVLIAGFLCYFCLPFFVKNEIISWNYVSLIYVMTLISIVLGYFLSYKRYLFIVSQQEYKCVTIDVFVAVFIQIIQLVTLAIFKNFILYLAIQLSSTLVSNIIISSKCNSEFNFIRRKYVISFDFIKGLNLFTDLRDLFIHKICYAVFSGTDNIFISFFCGVRSVALYGNYFMIHMGVRSLLFYKLLDPVQATIGNIVHSDKHKDVLWSQFNMLDMFSFLLATFIGISLLCCFQPVIELWMGKDYLLSMEFVIFFSFYNYLLAVWEIVYKYRNVFGDYKQDRFCMLISAVVNIIASFFGGKYFGIEGIIIGSILGFLPISYGRIRFIVRNFFGQSIYKYYLKHLFFLTIACLESFFCFFICERLSVSFVGLLERGFICAFVPLFISCLLFWKNNSFKSILMYFKRFFFIILRRIKNI